MSATEIILRPPSFAVKLYCTAFLREHGASVSAMHQALVTLPFPPQVGLEIRDPERDHYFGPIARVEFFTPRPYADESDTGTFHCQCPSLRNEEGESPEEFAARLRRYGWSVVDYADREWWRPR